MTISWYERSLEPERLWSAHYQWLLDELQTRGAWIGSANQIVEWFRCRRSISFKEYNLTQSKFEISPAGNNLVSDPKMILWLHLLAQYSENEHEVIDIFWDGDASLEIPFYEKESE